MNSQKSNSNSVKVRETTWRRSTEPTLITGKVYLPMKMFNIYNNIQLDQITSSIRTDEDQFLVLDDPLYNTGRKYWYVYVIGTKSPFMGWICYEFHEFKNYIAEVTPND